MTYEAMCRTFRLLERKWESQGTIKIDSLASTEPNFNLSKFIIFVIDQLQMVNHIIASRINRIAVT